MTADEPSDEVRVAPLPPDTWPLEMRDALAAMRPPNPRHPMPPRDPGRPKGLNVLGLFAHHPELARAYNTFNGHLLFATTLTPRQRELVVLRVAARREAIYEWKQHAVLAADVAITPPELEALRGDPDAGEWSDLERAMLHAVDQLLVDARVGDDTWPVLAAELDTQQLMDLVFTVGAYDLLAMAFRSFGIPLDDDLR